MNDDGNKAARLLYDRDVPADILEEWTLQTAAPKPERTAPRSGAMLVRAGNEWLGLPAAMIETALPAGSVHSVPRLSNAAFLGLTNVDGELLPCVRLSALLGGPADPAPARPRMVAVRVPQGRFALLVDEASGTCGYLPGELGALPATVALAPRPLVVGVIELEGRSAGLVGIEELGAALLGSLHP
ncbi:chemotaxis protein CheW [Fundidesulfovibrio soli]|uniref:chemotaxis protein CheW n=1 Tax=Fundidesulfovibrio soli TaxID=2922716 RepID=UPI001FAFEE89